MLDRRIDFMFGPLIKLFVRQLIQFWAKSISISFGKFEQVKSDISLILLLSKNIDYKCEKPFKLEISSNSLF